jgi:hypothetical protein
MNKVQRDLQRETQAAVFPPFTLHRDSFLIVLKAVLWYVAVFTVLFGSPVNERDEIAAKFGFATWKHQACPKSAWSALT